MKDLKVWPNLTVIGILIAALTGGAVALWMRHNQTSADEAYLSAARIQRVDGDVALNNGVPGVDANANWVPATLNQPFVTGDRIYTRNNSHANIAFTGRNFARLYPNTSLDVLSLNNRRTQLALRDGSAMFDVGYLAPGELFEVATPYGAVDLNQPGLYNVGVDNGNVFVSVLNGLAQVVGLGGSGQIGKGEILRLVGQTAADAVLSRLSGQDAGYLVNDYYGSQYPNYYDGRYADYNTYLNDPNYFDPYGRSASYQYAPSYLPGLSDLDYYGDWQNVSGYGYAWRPRVDNNWAPYEQGYWMSDYPYGPTWVSSEPWGYAPYHYGRWANVNNQWFWVPDTASEPAYSPAMVAFLPVSQNEIGWVPLGPGENYAPRYYNSNWQPSYLVRPDNGVRYVNLDVPNSVTVVPIDEFTRGDDFRRARRADRRSLQNIQAVLDPLTLTPLRNAVVHSAWGRGKIDLPPGIARKLQETRVLTSVEPGAPPFRRNFARDMRAERVSDKERNQSFQVKDERRAEERNQNESSARDVRSQNEQRGNQDAARQQRDAERGQQREAAMRQVQAERAARAQSQNAVGERVGRPAQQQAQSAKRSVQAPRAAEKRAGIWERKPPERMPQSPRVENQTRPGNPRGQAQPQRIERSAAPQPAGNAGGEKHGNGGGRQQAGPPRGNEGRQQGPPAANPHGQGNSNGEGNGNGKGKGRKP